MVSCEWKTCGVCTRPRVWRMESVLRKLIIGLSALFGRSRRVGWRRWDGRCVHACNGWEQCRNVLQSFGECHNVTWPICVPTRIRAESRILAWPPLQRKGHPSMVVTMQSSRCIELNELIGNVQQFTDNDTLRMDTTTERLEHYSERIY